MPRSKISSRKRGIGVLPQVFVDGELAFKAHIPMNPPRQAWLMTEKASQAMNSGLADFLPSATRFLFFTGKGGVGKTHPRLRHGDFPRRRRQSCAPDQHQTRHQISTRSWRRGFPMSPHRFPRVPTLSALNIDPQEAARQYREKIIGPMRGILPEAALENMEEQLSGACTMEIAPSTNSPASSATPYRPRGTIISSLTPHRPAIRFVC